MTNVIPHNKETYAVIEDWKKKEIEAYRGIEKIPKSKLTVNGKTDYAPIFRVPLDIVYYNIMNGRIRAEILELETQNAKQISQWDKHDQVDIENTLLAIRPDENDKVKNDLTKHGQTTPGIITCDGILINGNRRKALLKQLSKEQQDTKYDFIEVMVLPPTIQKKELWLIEAGIQLSSPQQLDYGPINNLLKIREGIDSGLTTGQMSSRIYGVSSEEIERQISRLVLIDEYLETFLNKPKKYYLVKNLAEHFIDLQNILEWAKRPRGKKMDWESGPNEKDITALQLVAFYYIRIRLPHLRIRGLRDIFAIESAWEEAKKVIHEVDPELTEEEKKSEGLTISVTNDDDNDSEDDESDIIEPNPSSNQKENISNPLIQSTEAKDLYEEKVWTSTRQKQLKSFYEEAKEAEQISKQKQKPIQLAQRALKSIQGIPIDLNFLDDPDMDTMLGELILETNKRRKFLRKNRT